MNRIELDAYEKRDLINYLEYAKSHYYLEKPQNKWDDRYYNINRIDHLIDCINGKVKRDSIYASSYETIEANPTAQEKQEIRYRKKYQQNKIKQREKALQELEELKKKEKKEMEKMLSIWKD